MLNNGESCTVDFLDDGAVLVKWISRKKAKTKGLLCLSFTQDGIAIAATLDPHESATVSYVDFFAVDESKRFSQLKNYLAENNLLDMDCAVVLSSYEYRLVQINAPDVADEALGAAALWLVKDLIDVPITEAAVDAFHVLNRTGQPAKALAVVYQLKKLAHLRSELAAIGLELVIVDIAELALRNLLISIEQAKRGVGLLYLDQNNIQLLVIQGGMIGLIRRLNTTLNAENDAPAIKAQLVLEIQRSLDFYQTQLAKPSPGALYFTGEVKHKVPWLQIELQNQLALQANLLDVEFLAIKTTLTEELKQRCLTVLGETQRNKINNNKGQQVDVSS